jgi:H+/Cl- antiporter ClcA
MDKVDPRIDPIGHLLKDAPEYIICGIMASTIGLKVGTAFYKKKKRNDNDNQLKALPLGIISGILAGTTTYITTYYLHNFIRKSKLRKYK